MDNRLSGGLASEYIVAGELMRRGLRVYMQCGGAMPVDMIVMTDNGQLYKVEVKSVEGYNRIIGVHRNRVEQMDENYILIVHYRHEEAERRDEFYYFTRNQLLNDQQLLPEKTEFGDLILNEDKRREYRRQNLDNLVQFLQGAQASKTAG